MKRLATWAVTLKNSEFGDSRGVHVLAVDIGDAVTQAAAFMFNDYKEEPEMLAQWWVSQALHVADIDWPLSIATGEDS